MWLRMAAWDFYPSEAVKGAPQLPGFSGQAYYTVGTRSYVQYGAMNKLPHCGGAAGQDPRPV